MAAVFAPEGARPTAFFSTTKAPRTAPNPARAVADTLLARQFDPDRPNVAWSADITYVPTADGWLYLAVVEDLFSRRIVGWSMDQTTTSRLVVDALDMAVGRRLP